MAKRALRVGVSLALMVVLLAWFLRGADLDQMVKELRQADQGLLAAGVLLALLAYWLRAWRWQMILRPLARVHHGNVVMAISVGYAGITLLPARMGDLIRPLLLARRERISVTATLVSVLTERIFDLWTVVLFLLVFLVWPPAMVAGADPARLRLLSLSAYLVGTGVVVGTAILVGLLTYQEAFVRVMTAPIRRFSPRWQDRVERFWGHFLDGMRVLHRPRDLAVTVAGSVALWLAIYYQLKVTLLAFAIDLPLRACFFVVAGSIVGLAVPTPGAVGGFHKAMELGLGLFVTGGAAQQVKSFVIAHHAICFLPITLIGLACLPLVGLSFGQARSIADQAVVPGDKTGQPDNSSTADDEGDDADDAAADDADSDRAGRGEELYP